MKLKEIITFVVIIVATLLIAGSILGASYINSMGINKATKAQAIESCYSVASGKHITVSQKDGWTVEKASIDNDVLSGCLEKQGV